MNEENNIIDSWLDQHGDGETDLFIDKNIAIVDRVVCSLKEKGISKQDFAAMMEIEPSELSKWLGGMHNLTLKSIIKMEYALGIDLIYIK